MFNHDLGKWMRFCYDARVTNDALPAPLSTITSDNDAKVLPLISRPCEHTETAFSLELSSSSAGVYPMGGWSEKNQVSVGYCDNLAAYMITHSQGAPLPVASHLPESDLRMIRDDAYSSCRPSFSSDFSLINFLIELKQFGSLFKVTDEKWGLKDQVENNFLNWTFGWVPFASDLVNLHGAYKRVKNVWDHIKANSDGSVVTVKSKGASKSRVENSSWAWQNCRTETTTTTLIQMRYILDVLDTDTGARSTVPDGMYAASVAQALGLCADPSIVWNALPFSFVIDWFIPISDALERMKRDTFVPGHRVIGSDLHTKTIATAFVSGAYNPFKTLGDPNDHEWSFTCKSKRYSRSVSFGPTDFNSSPMDALGITNASGKQWFIGAVLGSHLFL
jgi:hypothetical protein